MPRYLCQLGTCNYKEFESIEELGDHVNNVHGSLNASRMIHSAFKKI